MRCHNMALGPCECPGVGMSPEFVSDRGHQRRTAEVSRLDNVLRSAWGSLLEQAEDDVRMWTIGLQRRGRSPKSGARVGLPSQDVWSAFLGDILDSRGLATRARMVERHSVAAAEAARIGEAIGSQRDSILSCLGWATAFVGLYYEDEEAADFREALETDRRLPRQELRRRLLPEVWRAVADESLEPWNGGIDRSVVRECLIGMLVLVADKATVGDVIELVGDQEIHDELDGALSRWVAPPGREGAGSAGAAAGGPPVLDAFWAVACQNRSADGGMERAWDEARRLIEPDADDDGVRARVAQMEAGLELQAEQLLVDKAEASSLSRRVPFGRIGAPRARRDADQAECADNADNAGNAGIAGIAGIADDTAGTAVLELDFMGRVRRCMRGAVSRRALRGTLADEASRCGHWSGLGDRTDRAVLLEGMMSSALVPGDIERRNNVAARRLHDYSPAPCGGLAGILSFHCWEALPTMRFALEASSSVIYDDEDLDDPWSASTLSLGSLRAQDLAQRIPPRFARTLWSRLHYWEFIKRDRTWTWSTMVSKFSLILKDVNRWIEKGREDADETAVVYGGERS